MNTALFHAARPGDISDGRRRRHGGRAREAAAVAKQMGLGGGNSKTENVWRMLDDLAVTDSKAYEEMVKAGREGVCKSQSGQFFTPSPGFVVKTFLCQPWAPPPGGSKKISQQTAAGTKVFVNVCGHDGVAPPIDQAERKVDTSTASRDASGLRMPMVVSAVRETEDHQGGRALALDVVYNPWVLRCCREPRFRNQVVYLALKWAMDEHSGFTVRLSSKVLKAARPFTASEAADVPPEPSALRRARADSEGEVESGEPQRKRRRTTRSSTVPGPSTIIVAEGRASKVGPNDAAGEDASYASLVETALSVCSQVSKYKGGGGALGGEPVPFPFEDASEQSKPVAERQSPGPGMVQETEASRSHRGSNYNGNPSDVDDGILDPSMSDPKSLLQALNKSSSSTRHSGVLGENGDSSTTNGKGIDPEHAGRERPGKKQTEGTPLDLRLPGSLSGLSEGSGDGSSVGGAKSRGPLISEITETPPAEGGDPMPGQEKGGVGGGIVGKNGGVVKQGELLIKPGGKHAGEMPKKGRKTSAAVGGSVVKKGFLFKVGQGKAQPLYPKEGSENGTAPGTYSKLMSRCKVVDTNTMSKEQVGQAVRAHADGEASTHEKTTSASTTSATSTTSTTSEPIFSTPTTGRKKVSSAVRKGFLKGSSGGFLYGDEGSREGDRGYYRNTSEGNKKPGIDQDFERLVAEADPDMSSAQASAETEDPITEQLAQLSKILGPSFPTFPAGHTATSGPPSTSNKERTEPEPPTSSSKLNASSDVATVHDDESTPAPMHTTPDPAAQKVPPGSGPRPSSKSTSPSPAASLPAAKGIRDEDPEQSRAVPPSCLPEESIARNLSGRDTGIEQALPAPQGDSHQAKLERRNQKPCGVTDGGTVVESRAPSARQSPGLSLFDTYEGPAPTPWTGTTAEENNDHGSECTRQASEKLLPKATKSDTERRAIHSVSSRQEPLRERGDMRVPPSIGGSTAIPEASISAEVPSTQAATPKVVTGATAPLPPPSAAGGVADRSSDLTARAMTERAHTIPRSESNRGSRSSPARELGASNGRAQQAVSYETPRKRSVGSVVEETRKVPNDPGSEEREPRYRIEVLTGQTSSMGATRQAVIVINLPDVVTSTRSSASKAGGHAAGRGCHSSARDATPGGDATSAVSLRKEEDLDIASNFEVDVTSSRLDLRVPGLYKLSLAMPFSIDADNVTARFNKPRAVLVVSAWGRSTEPVAPAGGKQLTRGGRKDE